MTELSVSGSTNLIEKHHFLFRRLHSLSGIVPLGVFLLAHLTTNSTIVWGAANGRIQGGAFERRVGTFQEEVAWINGLPLLVLLEVSLWLAIAFHAILGVYYARTGKNNTRYYGTHANKRYAWQRITGYISIFFIFYHVATLRWGWSFLIPPFDGSVTWSHHASASTLAAALRGSWEGVTPWGVIVSSFYFVGVTAVVFHFANGLWTAAITWGLTISVAAQQRWGYVCTAIGVALLGMAWASVIGFVMLDPNAAAEVEMKLAPAAHSQVEATH